MCCLFRYINTTTTTTTIGTPTNTHTHTLTNRILKTKASPTKYYNSLPNINAHSLHFIVCVCLCVCMLLICGLSLVYRIHICTHTHTHTRSLQNFAFILWLHYALKHIPLQLKYGDLYLVALTPYTSIIFHISKYHHPLLSAPHMYLHYIHSYLCRKHIIERILTL